ncbi:TonB-dependent receptor plug domain-containing protein [Ramlibacter sp. MMS24-I3-19]|uniref:TonB-dependent receptor plug domain-containing protein n=1 Tax=Ramlibacter sp. MMS24-I3-19 TaxID=3416606 RepID=UPI003CFCEE77
MLLTRPTAAAVVASAALVVAQDAAGQAPAASLPQVSISSSRSASNDLHTQSVVVFDRPYLEGTGEFTLGRILEKLPPISRDQAGYPALRGLGDGRTQILIDGVQVQGAALLAALTTLPSGLIERVEITFGAASDTSAQAMAGTIQIVTRSPHDSAPSNQIRALLAVKDGRGEPKFSFQTSGKTPSLSYVLAGFVQSPVDPRRIVVTSATSPTSADAQNEFASSSRSYDLSLSGKTAKDITSALELGTRHAFSYSSARTSSRLVAALDPQPLIATNQAGETFLENELRLSSRRSNEPNLELYGVQRVNILRNTRVTNTGQDRLQELLGNREVSANSHLDGLVLGAKRVSRVREHLQLTLGAELSNEWRSARQLSIGEAGGDSSTQSDRAGNTFAKLEGDLSKTVSADAGIRAEFLHRTVDRNQRRFQVLAPSAGLLLKLPTSDLFFNRLRLSASESYRPPKPQELSPIVSYSDINSLFAPDRLGNVRLADERATGLDATLSRDYGTGSNAAIGLFRRDIRHPIVTTYANGGGRWLLSFSNANSAVVTGLEARGKLVLRDVWPGSFPCSLRLDLRSTSVSLPDGGNSLTGEPTRSLVMGSTCTLTRLKAELTATLREVAWYRSKLPGATVESPQLSSLGFSYVQDLSNDAKLRLDVTEIGQHWQTRYAQAQDIAETSVSRRYAVFTMAVDVRW